jgi:peroxiredoxin
MKKLLALLILAAVPLFAAPKDVQTLKLGDPAPDFHLKGVDGKMHTLADYAKGPVLVVMFNCNHCPTAQAIEQRFITFTDTYRPKGVEIVVISPNSPAGIRPDELGYSQYGDSYEDMVKHAKEQGFNFPYLYDGETQSIAKAYGCLATPHMFVFDRERKLQYKGRFDDSRYTDISTIQHHDTINAVEALLAGKAVTVTETRPHGCSTKWANKADQVKQHAAKLATAPVEVEVVDTTALDKLIDAHPRFRMINLWATWCVPCVEEFPDLVAISQKFGLRDFEFMSISRDNPKDLEKVKNFLAKQGAAPESKLAKALAAEGRTSPHVLFTGTDDELAKLIDPEWPGPLPYTVLIDADGKIIYRHSNRIDAHEVTEAILKELGRFYQP